MLDSGRFQVTIKVEVRARHFLGIGRDGGVPCRPQLVQQLLVNGLARERGRGHLCPFGLCPELGVCLFRQRQMEVLHVCVHHYAMSKWHALMESSSAGLPAVPSLPIDTGACPKVIGYAMILPARIAGFTRSL
jgi:hypothetical protein